MHFDYAQYKQKGQTVIFLLIGLIVLSVVAGGAYYFSKSQTPKPQPQNQVTIPQTSPPTITPSSSSDETANWKTYKNTVYSFEFKYPIDLKIVDVMMDGKKISDTETVDFLGEKSEGKDALYLQVKIYPQEEQVNFREWLNEWVIQLHPDNKKYSIVIGEITPYKNSSLEGYSFEGGTEGLHKFVFLQNKQNIIKFALTGAETGGSYKNVVNGEAILDQIISTFKFLDKEEATEGRFCGGIAANLPEYQCPSGYKCQLEGNFPDAGGKCVKK